MINRMVRGLAALIGAAALTLGVTTGAASATETDYPDEFTVSLVDCQVTVQANSIPYHVSSGTRTAGLAIRVNEETVAYTEPKAMKDGAHTFSESLSSGPVVDGDVVEFRWFAGPVRNDLPLWDLDHPELNEIIDQVERPDGEFIRHWNAGDDAEFVNWYTFGEITGCPAPSPSPTTPPASPDPSPSPTASSSPTASPDPSASPSLDPTGDQLPVTSGVRLLPALLIGGFLLTGVGTSLYYVTRRKVDPEP